VTIVIHKPAAVALLYKAELSGTSVQVIDKSHAKTTIMKQTAERGILLEAKEKLQIARQELDELTVQLALGKAEARDKFDEIKRDFLKRIHELNQALGVDGNTNEVNRKISALEKHLRVDEANAKGTWDNRFKNIFASLEEVKSAVANRIKTVQSNTDFEHEVEMFKLKLEILRLKFGLKKFEAKEGFHAGMEAARKAIESVAGKVGVGIKGGHRKLSDFHDEAQIAYKHFRKALHALR
jgi:hypothetical protein